MNVKPIPGDVLRAFDNTVLLLNELAAEAAEIKQKYGERSKLLEKKIAQIETIKKLYNKTKAFIELAVDLNTRLGVETIGLKLQLTQELYGMTFSEAAAVIGMKFSDEFIKAQDDVDKIIKDLRG